MAHDFLGNELSIGDDVVFLNYNVTSASLERGKITKVSEHTAEISGKKRRAEYKIVKVNPVKSTMDNTWIPVSERLPEAEDGSGWANCVVTCLEPRWLREAHDIANVPKECKFVASARFDTDQKIWYIDIYGTDMIVNAMIPIDNIPLNDYYVTHWMPFPGLPKEKLK